MLDIGFFELLVIAIVLLLVMGPERLPEVAKQAAFFIRKARQGMYRLRSEMRSEMDGTPFADLENAKREMTDLKNDIKQFGRELADSAETSVGTNPVSEKTAKPDAEDSLPTTAEGSLSPDAEGSLPTTAEGSKAKHS
jgi:sec-independent protein translocase protein TatB